MPDLELGLIGNSALAALVDDHARVVWCCAPRFDGDPVFHALLSDGADGQRARRGWFSVDVEDLAECRQEYVENTAVLRTVLTDERGGELEVIDFAPRFRQFGRSFRPLMLVRQVRPLKGQPRIRVRLRPSFEWGTTEPRVTRGSNHVRWVGPDFAVRLTTDLAPIYILEERPVVLARPLSFVLGADESLTEGVAEVARAFLERTIDYWRTWVRGLAIPFDYQDAIVRAAIALHLCVFEETGAIVAAMTTSIPESAHSGRNWDYRYCWLRDAFFVIRALNRLGAVEIMEGYLRYLTNVVRSSPDGALQPVYGISLEHDLVEREADASATPGYRGMGPVRIGNQACEHAQHDVYGDVVLAASQAFFDQRLTTRASAAELGWLEPLGDRAWALHEQPDAGMWEFRGREGVHTSSSFMCWAACDRLARIAGQLGDQPRADHWRTRADAVRRTVLDRAWNDEMKSFTATFGGDTLDASLLLMPEIGLIGHGDPRFVSTLAAVERDLRRGDHLLRYSAPDDFGAPESSFIVCTLWYIEALAGVGRVDEARELFENVLACRTRLGLLSEDLDPRTGELWGNFPQTYSLVGLIHCARRLSRRWEDVL